MCPNQDSGLQKDAIASVIQELLRQYVSDFHMVSASGPLTKGRVVSVLLRARLTGSSASKYTQFGVCMYRDQGGLEGATTTRYFEPSTEHSTIRFLPPISS